jgi:hypothetical protein
MGENLVIKDYNIKILDITKCQLYPFDHLKKTCYGLVYKPLNYTFTQIYQNCDKIRLLL